MTKMFYEGDLQSGISKAVQESKLVACFVTDDEEESQLWENDFLQEPAIKTGLSAQTVLLRLQAGTQEAGYLAAIYPLPKKPTLVIIRNGELKEYLVSGASKEEFLRRLTGVLGSSSDRTASSTSNTSRVTTSSAPVTDPQPQVPQTSHSSQQTATPTTVQLPRAVQDLLAERSIRLEAQKKEQEVKEKVKRAADAKAKKEALEAATLLGSNASADRKYALMQKKRQQDARDERARILKRVEDDKAERREREANRKSQAKAKLEVQTPPTASSSSRSSKYSAECALQIRLFDGSTIRSRFPSHGTLRADVMPWINEKQSGDVPYTFKHVLTPLPNRNIEVSEEEQSLQALGLTPNATLILLPVSGYTSAYEGSGPRGIVTKGVSAGFGLVSSGIGAVTSILGSVLGGGASSPAPERQEEAPPTPGPSANTNVRTLKDQEDRRDERQFYNGNTLNFEPRKDDDDKKQD